MSTTPKPSYSRCPRCDNLTMHCICDEDETTDAWRPVVAGMNQWPLVLIAGFLLSGCHGPTFSQEWTDSLIDGAAHWMDRISLGCVVISAMGVSYLFCRILGKSIVKPRGTRGHGVDLERNDGPDHVPLVDWQGTPRLVITRDLGREVEMPESVARKINGQRERFEDQHRLRMMQDFADGKPMAPITPPQHHGHEF